MPGLSVQSGAVPRGGLRIGLVAGEPSGDLLGAGLARAIRRTYPDAAFCGIAGPAMLAEGVESWVPMERLSVMGITEIVRHLPELLRARREVLHRFEALRPDVVVGIDSPDFTLGLERRLRARGMRTVHYVSPTIWAWRPGRVHGIGKAADCVLCLFPFEPPLYAEHGIRAEFIGHPMADAIPMTPDRMAARTALGLAESGGRRELIALLPGSRQGEVERLGGEFAGAAALLAARHPGVRFVAAMATPAVRRTFEAQLAQRAPGLRVRLVDGRAREVMAAADVVLVASGTAALEAALHKRPMVVAYRVAPLTYRMVAALRLMKTERFSMPNLLAGEALVPELIQEEASAGRIADEIGALVADASLRARLESRFVEMHEQLRQDANRRAAEVVLELVGRLPEPLA
jgi:lipid-A-disaccharide synthase